MEFFPTFLPGVPFPAPPTPWGLAAWAFLFAGTVYALWRWRGFQNEWSGREWGIFLSLLVLVPLSNLYIGLKFSADFIRPFPGIPANQGAVMMVFSVTPLLLGGIFLGPFGAAALGAFGGLIRGAWDWYSIFPVVEMALLGAWFSVNARQRFRTPIYRALRQPLVSALLLVPLHTLFYVVGALFTQWSGEVAAPVTARLDFALSNAGMVALAFAGEALVAGVIAQIAFILVAQEDHQPLSPSPGERSLESRFLFPVGAFILLLLLTLLVGDWVVAGRAARDMLKDRLSSAAESAAQSVPFFLETGQNLAGQLAADPRLLSASGNELKSVIGLRIQAVPYFDEIAVIDAADKSVLARYPDEAEETFRLYSDEDMGVLLARNNVLTQIYAIPPESVGASARVSFLSAVMGPDGQVTRVLIARTTLNTNPLTLPLIASVNNMRKLGGAGFLLDENNRVLYHSDPNLILSLYSGERKGEPLFYDDTAPDGTRQLAYYQPVLGRPWSVVLTVPAQQAQQLALNIAMPLSLMIVFLAFLAMASLRLGLRVVTASLRGLAEEANRIAQGNLDHPLQVDGVDEVGQLRRSFEQMRSSLQARLNEINSLLRVSQGVASSLEIQGAVNPALEALMDAGASSARLILSPNVLPDTFVALPSRFTLGKELDPNLDEQILVMAQRAGGIVIPDLTESREVLWNHAAANPMALMAAGLRHENRYYGAIWAGFDQPRAFSEGDASFLATLAGQTALAISNAHLYLNAESSRRQLEAVLNSTPDLVLVTDHRDRLLLANQSAMKTLGLDSSSGGAPVTQALKFKPLATLLQGAMRENQSREVALDDNRVYFATASTVMVEGRPTGRVCIMRDVTHFKELDKMKSEFVATVSHDLRSPLTLMRGYATMLETVGELNEQQQGYVKKIIAGVENMSRIVNNLLDLGRIELGVGLMVENVSVLNVIERVVNALQLQAAQKNIVLSVELEKNMPHVIEADQALLHQAIYNLVENALKYTPENGSVALRANTQPGFITFAVSDTGIGISEEDLPRLFEKFYRGKQREARAQHGSGLGLAIVQSIAVSHGGKVWVESVLGKGSVFYLQIPLAQPKESKERPRAANE